MTFRPPIFVKIYAPLKPPDDWAVNRLPFVAPNPSRPFVQSDWPRTTDVPKLNAVGEPIGRVAPLLTPNPTRPFVQGDWPRTTDVPKLRAVGEPIGRVNPLLTPNPAQPFVESDWPSLPRIALSLKSDSYSWGYPLYQPNPAQPFAQADWPRPLDPKAKATGEAVAGDAPLLTPNPAQPFVLSDWPRPFDPKAKSVGEAVAGVAPLLTPNPARPFTESDWPVASRVPLSLKSDSYTWVYPLYANPVLPFVQTDWFQIRSPQKAKVDDVVNLLPVQTVVVVVSPPFVQSDWPLTATLRPRLDDLPIEPSLALYYPAAPFLQDDWPKPYPYTLSDRGESYGLNQNFPPPPGPSLFITHFYRVTH